jgi:hypothetical protein
MADNRDDVLARLARSDVVGLRDKAASRNYKEVLDDAVKRIATVCEDMLITINPHVRRHVFARNDAAIVALTKMVKLLEDSRLTINFKAPSWFYTKNKYRSYTNFWERGTTGASPDVGARDRAEMELAGYDGAQHRKIRLTEKEEEALDRIAEYGIREGAGFIPRMRPRYAALDFAGCRYGGCSKYGHSYLVLKDYLKANATFCHMDSFSVSGDLHGRSGEFRGPKPNLKSATCTFSTLGKLLLYCREEQLKAIANYALGIKRKGTENKIFAGWLYIEAHLHADIVFSRDAQYLMIARGKGLEGGLHPLWNAKWPWKKTVWDNRDDRRMFKNAEKFARDNSLIMLRI